MADDVLALTADLYDFIQDTEPTLLSRHLQLEAGTVERLRARAEELRDEFRDARERAGERLTEARAQASERFAEARAQASERLTEARLRATERLAEQYDSVAQNLKELIAELDSRRPRRAQVRELWQGLGDSYETMLNQARQIRIALPEGLSIQHIKPKNLSRNLFHASVGLLGIALYQWVLTRTGVLIVGGSLLAVFIGMDILRRVSPVWNDRFFVVFGRIARPSEVHRTPAAIWALGGMLVGVAFLSQYAVELGTLVLALGDPAASLVGKRWGRRKLYREKSLAGTTGFFVVAATACFLFLTLVIPGVAPLRALWLAAAIGAAGAFVELFSVHVDDNFTIPVLAGGVAMLIL